MKKVGEAKAKNRPHKLNAIVNHSTNTSNRLFGLILLFLIIPLVFFQFSLVF